jgi:predicted nucleic acid-binding protein
LNEYDHNHTIAERIFRKIQNGDIDVEISTVSLIEMELIYRSEKMEDELLKDLAAIAALPHVKYVSLTPDVAVASVYLRKTLNLTFFDSHYAATALNLDGKVISFDQAYDRVPGLTRIEPDTI